jgi:hypothetical protein
MFHHNYYDAVTRVKCSLSRSDGDSNRFLTSWWFSPHTNHTYRSSELQVTKDTFQVNGAEEQSWTALPRDRPTARANLGLTLRVPVQPPSSPDYQSEFTPVWKVSLASRSKGTLFGQLNVRHAFNMTRRTSNDWSLTGTDGKLLAPQNPVWLPPTFPSGLQLSINTWLFFWGSTLYS